MPTKPRPERARAGNSASCTWAVYLVRAADGVLYTGISTDVPRRLVQHAAGKGAKYLRGRGPLAVVYARKLGDRSLALRVERGLKALTKADKEALVAARPTKRALLRAVSCIARVGGLRGTVSRQNRVRATASVAEKRTPGVTSNTYACA